MEILDKIIEKFIKKYANWLGQIAISFAIAMFFFIILCWFFQIKDFKWFENLINLSIGIGTIWLAYLSYKNIKDKDKIDIKSAEEGDMTGNYANVLRINFSTNSTVEFKSITVFFKGIKENNSYSSYPVEFNLLPVLIPLEKTYNSVIKDLEKVSISDDSYHFFDIKYHNLDFFKKDLFEQKENISLFQIYLTQSNNGLRKVHFTKEALYKIIKHLEQKSYQNPKKEEMFIPNLFETMFLKKGAYQNKKNFLPKAIRNYEAHINRISRSASFFGIPFNRQKIEKQLIDEIIKEEILADCKLRMEIEKENEYKIKIEKLKIEKFHIIDFNFRDLYIKSNDIILQHKVSNSGIRKYYNKIDQHDKKEFKINFFINEYKFLTETPRHNIFFKKYENSKNAWITPPVSDGLLPGTMRQAIIDRSPVLKEIMILDIKRISKNKLDNYKNDYEKEHITKYNNCVDSPENFFSIYVYYNYKNLLDFLGNDEIKVESVPLSESEFNSVSEIWLSNAIEGFVQAYKGSSWVLGENTIKLNDERYRRIYQEILAKENK